jgi:NUMOD3 motif-containing protein
MRKISQAMSGPNNPNYGKKFSEEIKQRMRAGHAKSSDGRRGKGRPGRTSWNKGKTPSAEHRRNISEARKGKPHPHI